MGGNKQKKSSASSFFGLFKARWPRRNGDDAYYGNDDAMSPRKIRPFDDDKGPLVAVKADPRVDRQATIYIDKFHATLSESERQFFPQAAGKAAEKAAEHR